MAVRARPARRPLGSHVHPGGSTAGSVCLSLSDLVGWSPRDGANNHQHDRGAEDGADEATRPEGEPVAEEQASDQAPTNEPAIPTRKSWDQFGSPSPMEDDPPRLESRMKAWRGQVPRVPYRSAGSVTPRFPQAPNSTVYLCEVITQLGRRKGGPRAMSKRAAGSEPRTKGSS